MAQSAKRFPRVMKGFTLIEMLVVLAIISILGGLVLGAIGSARKTSQITQTQTMMTLIDSALKKYEVDWSDYPPSDGDPNGIKGSEMLLQALKSDKKEGPYLEEKDIKTVDSDRNGELEVADVWNQPILYWHHRDYGNTEPNKRSFRMLSGGPNRQVEDGTPETDDVVNWDKTKNPEGLRGAITRSGSSRGGGGGAPAKVGKLYELIVVNGQGSGAYPAGSKVELVATPPAGRRFGQWAVTEGSASMVDSYSSRTMLTMPDGNVRVEAKFK
jgi:prepilin-type N-terminal cleavage/methylation domain-containing protein